MKIKELRENLGLTQKAIEKISGWLGEELVM